MYLLALIGTSDSTAGDIDGVIRFHLERPAFWTGDKHDRWAKGTRVVAKIAGAKVVALTGRLDCLAPVADELRDGDFVWPWRYDVEWDPRPSRVVATSDLGAPFVRARIAQTISREDFLRAYAALHDQ